MGEIKQRDYMFDTFRGLLIWTIPISHFTRVAGGFHQDSLSGIVYITINVFVMQAFVFLSGYFSKKPIRARETAFKTFLWPLIIFTPCFFFVRLYFYGSANFYWDVPAFALWYLWALFIYRYFLINYIKIPYIFTLAIILYLVAGEISWLDETFALGRVASYFPFFLLGYYCTTEHLNKLRSLKKSTCALLGAGLLGMSTVLAFFGNMFPVGFYLLKMPSDHVGVEWYWGIIGRIMIFVLACLWIVLMVNILPNKKSYLSYVGMCTMPVYIFHLVVRYWVKEESIYLGIFPENDILYYVLIFGLASLCVVVFTLKPIVWIYDKFVDGTYYLFMLLFNALKKMVGCIDKKFENLGNRLVAQKEDKLK